MRPTSELFYRYLNNQCTPDEVKALLGYFDAEENDAVLEDLILNELKEEEPEGFEQRPEVVQVFNETDKYLNRTLFNEKPGSVLKVRKINWSAVAASIAILILGSVYFINKNNNGQERMQMASQQSMVLEDAKPGTEMAILTLADGTTVQLDAKNNQSILNEGGITIKKTDDGTLVYEIAGEQKDAEMKYNQLRTPKGAQYELLLPDGTRVWLNAASTLRYPLAFSGHERVVELTGEGYFEVAKSFRDGKHIPFYVKTPTQIVQVLGTEFNISAYEDDEVVRTTLISGKVNVSERDGNGNNILNPGEQSILLPGSSFRIVKTNPEAARAWKNGNFMYEDVYLKDILRQLSRWYNVSVDYRNIPQTRYNMLISRKETLQSVLNMLRKTGDIKFEFTNNMIKAIPQIN
jgi:transmembrane sensor